MSDAARIVQKLWSYCHVLRDDGLSRLLIVWAIALVTGAVGAQAQDQALSPADVVEQASKATVSIRCLHSDGSVLSGSGFIVDSAGLVVTNYHVAEMCTRIEIKVDTEEVFEVIGVFGFDLGKDLAILRVSGFKLPTVPLGDSDDLRPGDSLLVLGNPLGLEGSVTEGILSAVRVVEGARVLQMDAAASPGSSGGPVLNRRGEAVGVTTYKMTEGESLNFAVPINYVRGMLAIDRNLDLESLEGQTASRGLFDEQPDSIPRPGTVLTGYGNVGHLFQTAHLELLNYLSSSGVEIANLPSELQPIRGDEAALPYLLERLQASSTGSNTLLYMTHTSLWRALGTAKDRLKLQCYNSEGRMVWTEEVKCLWSDSPQHATLKTREEDA